MKQTTQTYLRHWGAISLLMVAAVVGQVALAFAAPPTQTAAERRAYEAGYRRALAEAKQKQARQRAYHKGYQSALRRVTDQKSYTNGAIVVRREVAVPASGGQQVVVVPAPARMQSQIVVQRQPHPTASTGSSIVATPPDARAQTRHEMAQSAQETGYRHGQALRQFGGWMGHLGHRIYQGVTGQ